jgi:hypothetical protein
VAEGFAVVGCLTGTVAAQLPQDPPRFIHVHDMAALTTARSVEMLSAR